MDDFPRARIGHVDTTFQDQTVYLTGKRFERCVFRSCTLVYSGGPSKFVACEFLNCSWHVDFVVVDSEQWDEFMANAAGMITRSLPKLPSQ